MRKRVRIVIGCVRLISVTRSCKVRLFRSRSAFSSLRDRDLKFSSRISRWAVCCACSYSSGKELRSTMSSISQPSRPPFVHLTGGFYSPVVCPPHWPVRAGRAQRHRYQLLHVEKLKVHEGAHPDPQAGRPEGNLWYAHVRVFVLCNTSVCCGGAAFSFVLPGEHTPPPIEL